MSDRLQAVQRLFAECWRVLQISGRFLALVAFPAAADQHQTVHYASNCITVCHPDALRYVGAAVVPGAATGQSLWWEQDIKPLLQLPQPVANKSRTWSRLNEQVQSAVAELQKPAIGARVAVILQVTLSNRQDRVLEVYGNGGDVLEALVAQDKEPHTWHRGPRWSSDLAGAVDDELGQLRGEPIREACLMVAALDAPQHAHVP